MIDVYDYDNGDGFSTKDRKNDIFNTLKNHKFQGKVNYLRPEPIISEDVIPVIHLKDGNDNICALVGAGIHLYNCSRCGGIYACDYGKDIASTMDCPYCGHNNMRISMESEYEFVISEIEHEVNGDYYEEDFDVLEYIRKKMEVN